jgi:hypothetical protein
VLFAHHAPTQTTIPLGLAGSTANRSIGTSEEVVASTLGEWGGTGDLNGDGDTDDGVLLYRRYDGSAPANSGLAVWSLSSPSPLPEWTVDGSWIACLVHEGAQGGLDRNGDGDADDLVHCVIDTRSGASRNLALSTQRSSPLVPSLVDGLALLEAYEPTQGGRDLNGDGDGDGDGADHVAFFYDARWDRLVNLRTQSDPLRTRRPRLFYESSIEHRVVLASDQFR